MPVSNVLTHELHSTSYHSEAQAQRGRFFSTHAVKSSSRIYPNPLLFRATCLLPSSLPSSRDHSSPAERLGDTSKLHYSTYVHTSRGAQLIMARKERKEFILCYRDDPTRSQGHRVYVGKLPRAENRGPTPTVRCFLPMPKKCHFESGPRRWLAFFS